MRRHDQRLQQQGDSQGAERALRAHQNEQQRDGKQRLTAALAIPHRPSQQTGNDESQGAGEIAMNHFVDGFAEIVVRMRIDMSVASRPVGTSQTCVRQPNPRAEHDDRRSQRGARQRKPSKPKQASLRIHGLAPSRWRTGAAGASCPRACPWAWFQARRTSWHCPKGR